MRKNLAKILFKCIKFQLFFINQFETHSLILKLRLRIQRLGKQIYCIYCLNGYFITCLNLTFDARLTFLERIYAALSVQIFSRNNKQNKENQLSIKNKQIFQIDKQIELFLIFHIYKQRNKGKKLIFILNLTYFNNISKPIKNIIILIYTYFIQNHKQIKSIQICLQVITKLIYLLLAAIIMRIGDYNVKPTNKDHAESYDNENNQLKKLHEERLKRQRQKNAEERENHTNPKQEYLVSVLKPVQKKEKQVLSEQYQKIFLNSLLTDQRDIKDKINTITISSFFQENPRSFGMAISKKIKCVLISTYGFQMEMLTPIAQSGVPFFLVNDYQEQGPGKAQKNFQGYPNMTLILPPRKNKGYGVFHSKVWLIKFDTFLRVVIGTGNQHVNDWAVWLNAYWYQDFPLKEQGYNISDQPQSKKQKQKVNNNQQKNKMSQFPNTISLDDSDQEIQVKKKPKETKKQDKEQQKNTPTQQDPNFSFQKDFVQTLSMVLNNMFPLDYSFEKEVGIDLKKYDFSAVKVVLIPSIPGRHNLKDNQMNKFGIAKVKKVISKAGPKIKNGTLTYNTSSLGVVQQNFVRQIYFGFMPHAQYFSTSNFRLIYPSLKYIQEQTGGQAQVLFLKNENYHKSSLKKTVFYHYDKSPKNPVSGAIPHLKTVIVQDVDKSNKNCIFYIGSHNMTKAAWGTYQKNDTQINFNNAQLGLLFLQYDKEYLLSWLPYKYPPRKYLDFEKPFLRFD